MKKKAEGFYLAQFLTSDGHDFYNRFSREIEYAKKSAFLDHKIVCNLINKGELVKLSNFINSLTCTGLRFSAQRKGSEYYYLLQWQSVILMIAPLAAPEEKIAIEEKKCLTNTLTQTYNKVISVKNRIFNLIKWKE